MDGLPHHCGTPSIWLSTTNEWEYYCPVCKVRFNNEGKDQVDVWKDPRTIAHDNARKWDLRFLTLAQHVSTWSKDPSTKCGAVIVRPNRTIASLGYNGFPRGVDDSPETYADRETKYSRVVHAEMNAILSCTERPQGYTIYTFSNGWGPACDRCAAHIVQAGLVRIVYDEAPTPERASDSIIRSLLILAEAGVEIKGYQL
jgi:dCMP deaminase